MKTLTYLSLGAGVQSTALLVMSNLGLHGCPRADVAIFADGEQRDNTVEDLKTWADLVERGLGDGGRGSHRGLFVAADCLVALAERP